MRDETASTKNHTTDLHPPKQNAQSLLTGRLLL